MFHSSEYSNNDKELKISYYIIGGEDNVLMGNDC